METTWSLYCLPLGSTWRQGQGKTAITTTNHRTLGSRKAGQKQLLCLQPFLLQILSNCITGIQKQSKSIQNNPKVFTAQWAEEKRWTQSCSCNLDPSWRWCLWVGARERISGCRSSLNLLPCPSNSLLSNLFQTPHTATGNPALLCHVDQSAGLLPPLSLPFLPPNSSGWHLPCSLLAGLRVPMWSKSLKIHQPQSIK